jgi:hypothetical protein
LVFSPTQSYVANIVKALQQHKRTVNPEKTS